MSSRILLSILIPTFNSSSTIQRAIDSILAQDFDKDKLEIIVVDDFSVDNTLQILGQLKDKYPGTIKIFKLDKNSGSPSQPRNMALSMARGEFVLFVDADDWLAENSLTKMIGHAQELSSDVLLIKFKGENGRAVPKSMFDENQANVDIFNSKVMWSFSPLKLFKRSLIEENNLRFPAFMPEDISFVLRAYLKADIVSVAADQDYYHVSYDNPTSHLSCTTWSHPDSNLLFLEDIMRIVKEYKISRKQRNATLMKRIFRRDVVNMLKHSATMQYFEGKAYFDRIYKLTKKFYRRKMYETCPLQQRILLDVAYKRNYDEFRGVCNLKNELLDKCTLSKSGSHIRCTLPEYISRLTIDVTKTNDQELLAKLLKEQSA